jgi:hypothetical protein
MTAAYDRNRQGQGAGVERETGAACASLIGVAAKRIHEGQDVFDRDI